MPFDNICSLPLTSDLIAQAIHPTTPLVTVGLAAGHVQTFRLPSLSNDADGSADDDNRSEADSGFGTIVTKWRTRRHKHACRGLAYSSDGETLYSCGLDGLVKAASASTGQVFAKWTLPTFSKSTYSPLNPESASATPDQLCALSPQTLLLSDQTGQIHLYDLRSSCPTSARPAQTHKPHSDCITSLTPLAPSGTSTSGWPKQWVSTGAGFLAVTDLRKGVSHTSEDQEDWLLSSAYVPDGGKAAGLRGDAVVVGGSTGVLTVWPRGRWEDQGARINVDTLGQGETVDAITVVSDRAQVIVGLGDGFMRVVDVKERKISYTLRHDDQEGVEALGIDVQGRLISAGGRAVKIWRQAEHAQEELARFNSKQELEEQDLNGMDGLEDSGDNEDKAAEEESEKAPKRRSKRQKNNRGNKTSDAVFAGID